MSSAKKIIVLVLLISLLSGCKETRSPQPRQFSKPSDLIQASMDAVGPKEEREKVSSIMYFSDCQSPKGAYTTELHSDTSGYTFFKQVYHFSKDSFQQVIHQKGRGSDAKEQPVSPETAYTLRSHEFMSILLELDKRFTDFQFPDSSDNANRNGYQLLAKDELGHDCRLIFDSTTFLLKEIRFQHPDHASDLISTSFSDWKKINGLSFPWRIVFTQGGSAYTFDIQTIRINDPGFKQE